jgi:alpha-ketoglutarate-dependent taurine dioxygenase
MIAAHQVWSSLPTAEDITVHLPEHVASALLTDTNLEAWINRPNQADLQSLAVLSPLSVQWLQKLNASPGALRITTGGHYTDSELRQLYAMTSRALGWINNRYTYFFDVMDRGLDYTKEAIPVSKTKAETGYHTDSTAKHYFPDIIGLLCLQPAKSGGESLITNAANLFQHITNEHPELKELLHQAWCRDVITPGTINNTEAILANDIPIYQYDAEGGVVFRYMRYWIESALVKLGREIPFELTRSLDIIDNYFATPEHAMCFRLERGDMLFVNNRFICHNRTAIEDGEKPRVYVRAWINRDPQD